MLTRSLLILSSAAMLAACSNQNTATATAQGNNPYGVPQSDPYGSALPPVTGERDAPYQPLPNLAETGTYAPDDGPAAPPTPPADDIYGGLSPAASSTPSTPSTRTPSAPDPSGGAATTVVVAAGDTLWGFSKKYGVSEAAIRAANNMKPTDNNVRLGQKIVIPAQ
jgi:nucleoid-associated protein YgaU